MRIGPFHKEKKTTVTTYKMNKPSGSIVFHKKETKCNILSRG